MALVTENEVSSAKVMQLSVGAAASWHTVGEESSASYTASGRVCISPPSAIAYDWYERLINSYFSHVYFGLVCIEVIGHVAFLWVGNTYALG